MSVRPWPLAATLALTVAALLSAPAAASQPPPSAHYLYRSIPLPDQAATDADVDSVVVISTLGWEALGAKLRSQPGGAAWDGVAAAVTAAGVDFAIENLVLLRLRRPASSADVRVERSSERNGELQLFVPGPPPGRSRTRPAWQCLAIVLHKGGVHTVSVHARPAGSPGPAQVFSVCVPTIEPLPRGPSQSCSTCMYWEYSAPARGALAKSGTCRRPTTSSAGPMSRILDGVRGSHRDDCCGAYRPASAETVAQRQRTYEEYRRELEPTRP